MSGTRGPARPMGQKRISTPTSAPKIAGGGLQTGVATGGEMCSAAGLPEQVGLPLGMLGEEEMIQQEAGERRH